jgi:hypothetical protein
MQGTAESRAQQKPLSLTSLAAAGSTGGNRTGHIDPWRGGERVFLANGQEDLDPGLVFKIRRELRHGHAPRALSDESMSAKAAAGRAGFRLSGLCRADQSSIIIELVTDPDVQDAGIDWVLNVPV